MILILIFKLIRERKCLEFLELLIAPKIHFKNTYSLHIKDCLILPRNFLVNMYYSLVSPYLYYCIVFLESTKENSENFSNLTHNESTNDSFIELNILILKDTFKHFVF